MAVLLYYDVARGRDSIIKEETARIVEKSRFLSQSFTTKIVSLQYILRDIHDRLNGDDLVYPDSSATHYHDVSALLTAKAQTLPANLLEGVVVFNSRCIYTASIGVDVFGERSRHPICKLDKVDPNRFYIHYLPSEKSLIHRPVLLIAFPFVGKDGQLQGGIIAVMNLTSAQEEIRQNETKNADVMVVMDDQNNVLASKPAFFRGISSSIIHPSSRHDVQEIDSIISIARAVKTKDHVYAVHPVFGTPLLIVVGVDIYESLSEWNRRALQLAVGMILIIVLSFVLAKSFINLRQQRDAMERLALIDPLTGIANRRRFMQGLQDEHQHALSTGATLSLLIIDIDHFKRINDTWGHPTGDRVIKEIARILTLETESVGLVGRLGGEEFGIILPSKGEIFATHFAEQLRQLVATDLFAFNDNGDRVYFQISIGISTILFNASSKEELLSQADKALYEAKRKGRNQVAVASPPFQPVQERGVRSWWTQSLIFSGDADAHSETKIEG